MGAHDRRNTKKNMGTGKGDKTGMREGEGHCDERGRQRVTNMETTDLT